MPQPLHVVRLTAPGRGAVATILVTGRGAVALADRLFHARGGGCLAKSPAERIVVGRFGDPQDVGEEIVARRVADDEVLLHCHGGTAAVARIESLLVGQGAVAADWTAWATDAHEDRLQAEALVALAKATTQRTAAILLDQYHHALRRKLDEIDVALAADNSDVAAEELDGLLARSCLGLHLTDPWKVVLAGPPNTGKSSLINALLGYQRAIVHATPGTTRDALTAGTSIEGWPVELIDTAGLGEGRHPIETEGIRRARKEVARADLVLLVFDSSRPFAERASSLAKAWPSALVIHNKSDLPSSLGNRPEGLSTSALTGDGVPELLQKIADRLVPEVPTPGEATAWTARQVELLRTARAALAGGHFVSARQTLALI